MTSLARPSIWLAYTELFPKTLLSYSGSKKKKKKKPTKINVKVLRKDIILEGKVLRCL